MAKRSRSQSVRLIDVAKRANVSRVVVGHVLLGSGASTRVSPATAERVRKIAREMDYRPNQLARQLSGKRTRTIGAIIDANSYPIHYQRLRAIERESDRRGYRLMVGYLHSHEPDQFVKEFIEQLNDFEGRGVEGIMLPHGIGHVSPALRQRLQQTRFPVIQSSPSSLPEACTVGVDIAAAMEMLYDHLVACGRQRIGLLLVHSIATSAKLRKQGFKNAAAKHGRSTRNSMRELDLPYDIMLPQSIRKHTEGGIDHLVGTFKADAIMASNDQWAVQIIKALIRRGIRVPEDVAVTGIDNADIAAAVIPELTTIDQCNADVASTMFDLFEAMAAGKTLTSEERYQVLTPRLVVRESTASGPSAGCAGKRSG